MNTNLRNPLSSIFFVVFTLTFLSDGNVVAQNKLTKEMKERESILTKAEDYLQHGDYQRALPLYSQLDSLTPNDPVINYKLGLCYLHSSTNKAKALAPIEFAAKHLDSIPRETIQNEELSAETYYNLGKAYHFTYRLDEAIDAFAKYKTFLKEKDKEKRNDVDRQTQMCNTAKELMKKPVDVTLTNLGNTLNSPYPEYSPCISGDESVLIFTSRRPGSTGNKLTVTDEYYEDIYIAYRRANGTWIPPVSIGENINTPNHEASVSLSADGQQLFIYKNDKGDGNIYICNLEGKIWSTPQKLEENINSKSSEPSASLSVDGNTLFFVSNRNSSIGGRDIYMARKLPNGKWAKPKNLGNVINTPYDEDSPFIHPDGKTLYFSSNGHNTMGGFDIFSSTLQEDGTWSEPRNIGYPINGTDDDIFYVETAKGNHAYYSSVKADGLGEQDIYLITLSKEVPMTVVKGIVTTEGGNVPPVIAKVTLTDKETGKAIGVYKPNTETGKYQMILAAVNKRVDYTIEIEREGYPTRTEEFYTPANNQYYEQSQEIHYLTKEDANKEQSVTVFNRKFLKAETVSFDDDSSETDSLSVPININEEIKSGEEKAAVNSSNETDKNQSQGKTNEDEIKTENKNASDTVTSPQNIVENKSSNKNNNNASALPTTKDTIIDHQKSTINTDKSRLPSTPQSTINNQQSSITTSNTSQLYYIQVGAFRNFPDINKLKKMGKIEVVDVKGARLTRYVIGSFDNKKDAEQMRQEIVKKGCKDAFLILLSKDKVSAVDADLQKQNPTKKQRKVQTGKKKTK